MLSFRSSALSSSLIALFAVSSLSRLRDPRRPARGADPLPVAAPGDVVRPISDRFRGLGVRPDGPGALGVMPGLVCGGGGVCGTGIAEIPGFVPAVPPLVVPPVAPPAAPPAPPAPPAWDKACDEHANIIVAASNPGTTFLRIIAPQTVKRAMQHPRVCSPEFHGSGQLRPGPVRN